MPAHDNKYTIGFVSVIAVVCSLLLSVTSTALKDRQEANIALDIKKNILKSLAVLPENVTAAEIEAFYGENVDSLVVDYQGNVVSGDAESIDSEHEEKNKPHIADRRYPVYILKDGGHPIAYSVPVIGKGLWSTLYGYLSLESDLNTVRGITFYKHGETPGLGAEIDADWFQENFKGKSILDNSGNLVSVSVVKGKAADLYSEPKLSHYVDGISGATITSKGVTELLDKYLSIYEPYFSKIR